jgi:hypothetical protein
MKLRHKTQFEFFYSNAHIKSQMTDLFLKSNGANYRLKNLIGGSMLQSMWIKLGDEIRDKKCKYCATKFYYILEIIFKYHIKFSYFIIFNN